MSKRVTFNVVTATVRVRLDRNDYRIGGRHGHRFINRLTQPSPGSNRVDVTRHINRIVAASAVDVPLAAHSTQLRKQTKEAS